MVMGYLVDRLDSAEEESRKFQENADRLRGELEAEEKRHSLTRESFSTRAAELVQHLEKSKTTQAQLTVQHASLVASKERVDEANRVLQAEVVRLTDTLADFMVRVSAPAESRVNEVVTAGALDASMPTSSGGFVGPVVSPAEGSSSISAATAAESKETSSLSAVALSRPSAEVSCMDEPIAPDFLVGTSSPAESTSAKAVMVGAVYVGAPAATLFSRGVSVGPAVSPAKGSSSSSSTTASKIKAASPPSVVTPSSPRVEVAPMSEPVAAIVSVDKVVAYPPAASDVAEAVAVDVVGLGESTPTSLTGSAGPIVSPAEGISPSPVTATTESKVESSPLAVTSPHHSADVAHTSERLAATLPVDIVSPSESAIGIEAATSDAINLGASTATPSEGFAGPTVSPTRGSSSFSSITATKGKTAPSPWAVTPPRPGMEAARPSPLSAATFPVGKMASPPTSSRFTQLTLSKVKARNPADGGNYPVEYHFFEFNSPPVRKDFDKGCGPPWGYTRRPLTPVNANSGSRKRAAEAERPSFAVRSATRPYDKRSSTGGEVPSLASRGVTQPAPKPCVKRSSTAKEVPPLSPRVGAKPAVRPYLKRGSNGKEVPSLAARVAAVFREKKGIVGKGPADETGRGGGAGGSVVGNGPVGKGPALEIGRGGGARTGGLMSVKWFGGGRKVEVASSGRALRSASKTAAAAGAAANNEAGTSAASGTVTAANGAAAAAAAPVKPTRSARSGARWPAQRTATTRSDVSSRGKFMNF